MTNSDKEDWTVIATSECGEVSVIKNLTFDLAKEVYERADPWYGKTVPYLVIHGDYNGAGSKRPFGSGSGRIIQPHDIKKREIVGPAGWEGLRPGEITEWPRRIEVLADDNWRVLSPEHQPQEVRSTAACFWLMQN